jgi:hypothetical protein
MRLGGLRQTICNKLSPGALKAEATKRTPRPRDPIQLGKLMVDIATGAVPDVVDNGTVEASARARPERQYGPRCGYDTAAAV